MTKTTSRTAQAFISNNSALSEVLSDETAKEDVASCEPDRNSVGDCRLHCLADGSWVVYSIGSACEVAQPLSACSDTADLFEWLEDNLKWREDPELDGLNEHGADETTPTLGGRPFYDVLHDDMVETILFGSPAFAIDVLTTSEHLLSSGNLSSSEQHHVNCARMACKEVICKFMSELE